MKLSKYFKPYIATKTSLIITKIKITTRESWSQVGQLLNRCYSKLKPCLILHCLQQDMANFNSWESYGVWEAAQKFIPTEGLVKFQCFSMTKYQRNMYKKPWGDQNIHKWQWHYSTQPSICLPSSFNSRSTFWPWLDIY